MPEKSKTYEEIITKRILSIEAFKESKKYNEKDIEKLKEQIDKQTNKVAKLDQMAIMAGDIDISFSEQMVSSKDELRELNKKLVSKEKLQKEIDNKMEEFNKYVETLENEKESVKKQISVLTDEIKKDNDRIKELKAKEHKTPEELEELNSTIARSEKNFEDRKSARNQLGKLNAALKLAKEYREEKKTPKSKEEQAKETEKKEPHNEPKTPKDPKQELENDNGKTENRGTKDGPDIDDSTGKKGNGEPRHDEPTGRKGNGEPRHDEPTGRKGKEESKREVPTEKEGKEEPKHETPIEEKVIEEEKINEPVGEELSEYDKKLNEYKTLLEMYNQDFETLGELQEKLQNGEIEYSEYEDHALYMSERYSFMNDEYKKMMELYEKGNNREIKELTEEELLARLKELDEKTTEKWQESQEASGDFEDKEYTDMIEEMKKIKEEIGKRKENPYRDMSDEELKAKLEEINEEYQFRAHEENGMEEHDDSEDILKTAKEIEEELKRRKTKDLEKPQEPVKPGMIAEKDQGKDPISPKPGQNLPIPDSGLQVLKDIFTHEDMPEIKAKHMSSENPAWKFWQYGLPAATAAGLGVGAMVLGAPITLPALGITAAAVGVSAVTKPIVAKLTGKKKITEQVKSVIEKMPPERIKLLAEYLDEEQIIDLMPNEIFLDAFQEVLEERGVVVKDKNDEQLIANESRRQEIVQKIIELREMQKSTNLTQEQKDSIEMELKTLDSEAGKIIKEREELKVETKKSLTEARQVRRGKERKGHGFRGNVSGKADGLFALKNAPSKDYVPQLVEAAKKEQDILIAQRDNKSSDELIATAKTEEYMREHSKGKEKGTRRLAFNMEQSSARDVSDRADKRIDSTARGLAIGIGVATTIYTGIKANEISENNYRAAEHNAKQLEGLQNGAKSLDNTDTKGVLDGATADLHSKEEYSAFTTTGSTGKGTEYLGKDSTLNRNIEGINKGNSGVKGISDTLKRWADIIREGKGASGELGQHAISGGMDGFHIDHSVARDLYQNGANGSQQEAQSELLEKLATIFENTKNVTIQHGIKPIRNLIACIIPAIVHGQKEASDSREGKKREGSIRKDASEKNTNER